MPTFLSKSKYLAGLQCSKLLWYYYNAKEKIPAVSEATQAVFDQGHVVGELAKRLFPGGIEVAKDDFDFSHVLSQSKEAIKLRKPLFEAGFKYKSAYARADILVPVGKDQWDIFEVKSSTQVKNVNLHDLAIQKYTYNGAGLRIRRCHVIYVNNQYVRRGPIDPKKLLIIEDVSKDVDDLVPEVEGHLNEMTTTIALKRSPEISIGLQCSDPYDCPMQDICWKFLPANNVLTLYRLGSKAFELLDQGVMKIVDIPESIKLNKSQKIQIEAARKRRAQINKPAIDDFLKNLEYPLHYLDFETFSAAIPLFDYVRPYQQIPFQFSLHVIEKLGAKPVHHSFLADGEQDPRPEILSRLKDLLGTRGSIVSYNAAFERARIRESCEVYPKYSPWWEKIEGRMVDLLAPFRAFYYYHPMQEGSASMKVVLPALTGKGYEGMAVSDGGTASREFMRVTFGNPTSAERKKVRSQLERYCARDTEGMVEIVKSLSNLKD